MKKLLFVGFSSFLLLSACSSDEPDEVVEPTEEVTDEVTDETTEETTEETTDETAATENTEVKSELINFYITIPNTINQVDADLNAYELLMAEETLPEGEELTALKEGAIASAEEASAAVQAIEIPEALSEEEEDIQAALAMISESYDMKAAALAEEETSFEAANAKFVEADESLNALLEEYDLIPSSIQNEVN